MDDLVLTLSSGSSTSSRSSSPWPTDDENDNGAACTAPVPTQCAPMVVTLGPAREVHVVGTDADADADADANTNTNTNTNTSTDVTAPRLSAREELLQLDPDFAEPDRSVVPRDPGAFTAEERAQMTPEERRESRKIINLRLALETRLPRPQGVTPVRIGLLGNTSAGKSCLVSTFVRRGAFASTPETLGMGFVPCEVVLGGRKVLVQFHDLGGRREYAPLMPMTVVDADAVFYVVDLTDTASINALKVWYRQGVLFGRRPTVLVGTKYDLFVQRDRAFREKIVEGTTRYARAMHAPLFFTSALTNTNITELLRVVLSMLLHIACPVTEESDPAMPIRLFKPPFCPEVPTAPPEPVTAPAAPTPPPPPQEEAKPNYDDDFCFDDNAGDTLVLKPRGQHQQEPATAPEVPTLPQDAVPNYDDDFCFDGSAGDNTLVLKPRTHLQEKTG